ncbi:MAG TPA: serine/threonine-protein kinase [Verrucomicrobiae bacterium]|nr:serine/threonine-protein kinase [Verrucomicrobiae bacterium]
MNPSANPSDASEQTIFDAARQMRDARARSAYLQQVCEGHPELRVRVEKLLRAGERADEFLASDPLALGEAARPTLLVAPLSEGPGTVIGNYKLLEKLGEGGFGVVYMAEQKQPIKRRVALKIIKVGMDTREVVARFEAERQALAVMDHPNIAKVHDAGATETGRPYFIMELVRGIKITDYCDEKNLSTRERLDLFAQVCQAVQHAHQKGIIHPDLKPSNILVTVNDGVAVPKVIDFGIAKATQLELTEKTVFTRFHQFLGTPAYMSPEQTEITSVDIDTRSDIYSLGVLLYELLTGKTPFDTQELLKAGLDEMRRTIREKEPIKPSTRLTEELSRFGLDRKKVGKWESEKVRGDAGSHSPTFPPAHFQRGPHELQRLIPLLRGDLDWIVMKCLEKDRARRYETANGLASDIQRHLNNEPVVARSPSNLYRFQKMVRRNKVAFAATSAVVASLVIGLTMSTVLFFRERAARERANEQAAIARAVNDFLQQDLLQQASSRSQAEARFSPDPNLTVREALERAAERSGDRFKDQPLQEAAVRMAIGNALGGVGEAERSVSHLQRALELRRARLGPDHPDTLTSMGDLAAAYLSAGKLDQALPLAEETLKLRKANLEPDHPNTLDSMDRLAWAYLVSGKLKQALPLAEETLRLSKAKLGPGHPVTLDTMNTLANAYRDTGKLDLALPLFEETLKLSKATRGPDHPFTLIDMNDLANAYREAGKLDQALPLREETLKLMKAKLGPDHPDTLTAMKNLAVAFQDAGKLEQALPLFEETVKLGKAKLGPNHPETLTWMNYLATADKEAGKLDQALPLFEETLKLMKAKLGPDHPETLTLLNNLAAAYQDAGRIGEAKQLFGESLAIYEAKAPDRWRAFETRGLLGACLLAQKNYADAEPLLLSGYEGMKQREHQSPKAITTELKPALKALVQLYEETGRLDRAAEWKQKLAEFEKAKAQAKPAQAD